MITQQEIAKKLCQLRFQGSYSKSLLAKESGLSRGTIERAMDGVMSKETQVRLMNVLRNLPANAPEKIKKGKPGRKKRYLIRFFNLKKWIETIEYHIAVKKYKKWTYYPRNEEEAGYICCKMDYVLKVYLMQLFGDELKKNKMSLGDCYPAEQWIRRISTISKRSDLCKDLLKRT